MMFVELVLIKTIFNLSIQMILMESFKNLQLVFTQKLCKFYIINHMFRTYLCKYDMHYHLIYRDIWHGMNLKNVLLELLI